MASRRQRVKILVRDGKVITLYDDEVAQALQKGLQATAEIQRVSNVESIPGEHDKIEFTADLSPIGGPTLRGFNSYEGAVNAEIDWIETNHHTTKKPAGAAN